MAVCQVQSCVSIIEDAGPGELAQVAVEWDACKLTNRPGTTPMEGFPAKLQPLLVGRRYCVYAQLSTWVHLS